MAKRIIHGYQYIISVENLLLAWQEFRRGKKSRKDVRKFELNLMDNIILLHHDLKNKTYKHSPYYAFKINDPKPRNIHKATVRDRLLHRALYRVLYPFYDKTFIIDSYSCRINKGTHKAINKFRNFNYKVSKNNTKTAWVLKCDIRKFFASIDQKILIVILEKRILDRDIIWLLTQIISSFYSTTTGKGLPLGNLTSQLLVNIYMNEFDYFIKHTVKVEYYIRYADDFIFLSQDKKWLVDLLPKINGFLHNQLCLELHPDKVFMQTINSGVDFLGWVNFTNHRVLRAATKRRMFRRLKENLNNEAMQSYLGLLKHGNTFGLRQKIVDIGLKNR